MIKVILPIEIIIQSLQQKYDSYNENHVLTGDSNFQKSMDDLCQYYV